MTSAENTRKSQHPVQVVFQEFQEAWFTGKSIDPEALYRSNPECADELREKIEDFLFLAERLPHPGRQSVFDESDESKREECAADRVLGDFRIIREIGRGGMGTVYEAEQLSLHRRVALKILPAHLGFSKKAVMKFLLEAEAGGRQSHPGIVAVHAVGKHKGVHYIAQELMEGSRTLADWLDETRKKDMHPLGYFRNVARVIAEVANALEHAHEKGVIHRDIKPSNILLSPEGKPRVTDFGLAKVEGALALSRTGDFSGTPYYMSPEQVASRRVKIDKRTDIYSLGVTLYEMLTLSRPFEGVTSQEVLNKILIHEPQDPRKVTSRLPRDMAVICLKAMEKDPKNRYQSMAELSEELRRFLLGEVIRARPTGLRIRAWKWVIRHPVVSAPAGVTFIAIVTFIAYVLFWSYPRIKVEKDTALKAQIAAEAEKEKAKSEAVTANAALNFLESLFSSADPEVGRRSDITAKEILDTGVAKIQNEFQEQPEIKARLLSTMGNVYRALGYLTDAESLFLQALKLRRTILTHNHPDLISSLFDLGINFGRQDNFEKSVSLLKEALELRRNTLGEDHLDTLKTMNELAGLLKHFYRYEEAEDFFLESLEKCRLVLGNDHPQTIRSMRGLGQLYSYMDRFEEGESLLLEALEISRKTLGNDHPDMFYMNRTLAMFYNSQDRLEEAISIYLDVLDYCNRVLGSDHPNTYTTMSDLAIPYIKMAHYKKAESLLFKALEGERRLYGNNHSFTLSTINSLGTLYSSQKKYVEAESFYLEALEGKSRVLGKDNLSTLSTMSNLAGLYSQLNRYEEAEPLYKSILEGLRRALGNDHSKTFDAMGDLAVLYKRQGRYEEAKSLYSEVLEGKCRLLGEVNLSTLTTKHNLAVLYEHLGRYKKAESLYMEVFKGNRHILGNNHPDVFSALHRLGLIYVAQNRFEEAKSIFMEALEGQRRIQGYQHPDTLTTLGNIASIFWFQRSYERAEYLLIETLIGKLNVLGPDHKDTLITMNSLVPLYIIQNQNEKAELLCTEAYDGMSRALGKENLGTLACLHNLTRIYMRNGRFKEAESFARELVEHTPDYDRYYEDRRSMLAEIIKKLGETESIKKGTR